MDLVKVLSEQQLKSDLPTLKIGDTVKVHAKIKEGNRERIQVFEGIIIAKKHAGVNQTVTVRRISYGVGVEKTFPVHSPNVAKFEVVRSGKVRRAKLYYLRGRVGKAAKIAEKVSFQGNTACSITLVKTKHMKRGAFALRFLFSLAHTLYYRYNNIVCYLFDGGNHNAANRK